MKSKVVVEKEIQNSFDNFFILSKGERRPSDFKSYNRSIYNVLCKSYKNLDDKIDWDYILQRFVPEDKIKEFQRTNIYNKQWIIKSFSDFFESQKIKWKNTRTVWDLDNRNESLVMTISRKYGYNGSWFVNRETFIDEYKLNTLGCPFVRDAPIRRTIVLEAINKEIKNILKNNRYRSPNILSIKKPQYLKRLWKRYRDHNWKIDRLYILYKVMDIQIAKQFRHRYAIHRWLDNPSAQTNSKDISKYNVPYEGLNPEELLIQKEEQQAYLQNRENLYKLISNLSSAEQQVIQKFLAEEVYDQKMFFDTLTKLRNSLII